MDKHKISIAVVVVFILSFAPVMLAQAGIMPFVIVCGAMVGGFVAWLLTTSRIPTDPKKILPIYFLVAATLMLHIWEEYLFGFGPRIAAINGSGWTEREFLLMIAFYMPAFWILGALGIYYRHPLGSYVAWFVFIGMILGEPVHLAVFPLIEGGRYHYFPGMWTALLPMVPGIWGMVVVIKEYRKDAAAERSEQTPSWAVE